MTTPYLTADPDVVIVDLSAGQTDGRTTIKYDSDYLGLIIIWARHINGSIIGPWKFLNLYKIAGTQEAYQRGEFDWDEFLRQMDKGPFTHGQVLELRMYSDSLADPNQADDYYRVKLTLAITCLLKQPTLTDLVSDQGEDTGGTYHWHLVATRMPTFMVISVSQQPPVSGPNGMPRFAQVEGKAESQPNSIHRTELTPLAPGTNYYCLIRVSDNVGNWQFLRSQFRTRWQSVTVTFKTLHIDNDGDESAYGEADGFVFQILEGDNLIKDFSLGRSLIYDGQNIDLLPRGFTHTLGPKSTPGGYDLRIRVEGTEDDSFLFSESKEQAANLFIGGEPLLFPTGRPDASRPGELAEKTRLFDASAFVVGDEFAFTVTVTFVAQYS